MTDPIPSVTLELPSILEPVAGRRRFEVRSRTIAGALEAAFEATPALRHHLLDDTGRLRPHILCVVNKVTIQRAKVMETSLDDGDEILIHQAISGG
jgi:sulfur carrier protein ThiS